MKHLIGLNFIKNMSDSNIVIIIMKTMDKDNKYNNNNNLNDHQ
jgi:hypothetical protein